MKNKFQSRLFALLIFLVIPLGFYFYYKQKIDALPKRADKIATYWDAPAFTYATQYGDTLSSDSLKGRVYIADFIFTSCETVCPNLSKTMAQLQENFRENGMIKLVSFSIDPDRDSVPVLKEYADRYGAIRDKWYFLRGDKETIWNTVEKGYKVSVGYAPDSIGTGYSFTHSEKLVLVDGQGKVRGFYNGTDKADMDSLYNNIASLIVAKTL
jgi:protein SCO1/2